MTCFRFLSTILFMVSLLETNGQQTAIDSLKSLLDSTDEKSSAKILNELADQTRRQFAVSIPYAEKALSIAEKYDLHVEAIKALRVLGIANGYNNRYDLAHDYLQKSLALAREKKEWSLAGDAALNIGTIYYVIRSDYEKALEYYLMALRHCEDSNDDKGIAAALSGLGITYTHEKKYDQALETLFRSLEIYERLGLKKEIPKLHVNIGTAYKELLDYDKAVNFMQTAIREFDETQNKRGKAHALLTLGEIQREQNNFADALSTLKEALALNEESNHKNSIVDCNIALANTHFDMGEISRAEHYYLEVLKVAAEINKRESLGHAYEQLASIYSSKKDFPKAFQYLKLHQMVHDSIYDEQKSRQIAEMQERFDSERKEKEIDLLKKEQALNKIYLIAAISLTVLIATIGYLILNRQKMKIRNARELADKESQLMEERRALYETELRNRELTEQQLQSQLEYKNKELASYTLNLIQKNETLENIKEAVDQIRQAQNGEIKQKLNSLVSMVNFSFHIDKDWESFKMHFEQVHSDFFKKLLEMNPDLTANDLKLCSLIKLNLDNRAIATLLNISQESAKVARHRLRKKLELSADQTLISFLSTVE